MKEKILIIGGTGDIAQGIIPQLSKTYDIIVTYRNENKLTNIKKYLHDQFLFNYNNDPEIISDVIKNILNKHSISKVILANGSMINNLLITTSNTEVDQLIQHNIQMNIFIIRDILKQFIKKKKDYKNIIILSSLAGDVGNKGQSIYSLVKGAMNPFVKSIAREYGNRKVIINTLSLGMVDQTEMQKTVSIKDLEELKKQIPLNKFCDFDEIKKAIDFLLETHYYTGQTLKLNGGLI